MEMPLLFQVLEQLWNLLAKLTLLGDSRAPRKSRIIRFSAAVRRRAATIPEPLADRNLTQRIELLEAIRQIVAALARAVRRDLLVSEPQKPKYELHLIAGARALAVIQA